MSNATVRAADSGLPIKKSQSFAAFLDAVMSPVSTEETADLGYNSDMRRARVDAWRRASADTQLQQARMRLFNAEDFWRAMHDLPKGDCHRPELTAAWRAATSKQILTPAPDQAAVAWKRAAARQRCLPITAEAAAEAIAADEAFLAAHPVTRPKSRSSVRP